MVEQAKSYKVTKKMLEQLEFFYECGGVARVVLHLDPVHRTKEWIALPDPPLLASEHTSPLKSYIRVHCLATRRCTAID